MPEIAAIIDHTQLKPGTTSEDVVKLCDEARRYGFATVCVGPAWVELAARLLHGSRTVPITVVAFPLGTATPTRRCRKRARRSAKARARSTWWRISPR